MAQSTRMKQGGIGTIGKGAGRKTTSDLHGETSTAVEQRSIEDHLLLRADRRSASDRTTERAQLKHSYESSNYALVTTPGPTMTDSHSSRALFFRRVINFCGRWEKRWTTRGKTWPPSFVAATGARIKSLSTRRNLVYDARKKERISPRWQRIYGS